MIERHCRGNEIASDHHLRLETIQRGPKRVIARRGRGKETIEGDDLCASADEPLQYQGINFTVPRHLTGATNNEATAKGVNVTIEGFTVPVLSFDDTRINIHVPQELGAGVGSVVVNVQGNVTAADDAFIVQANPGVFTVPQTGAGEAITSSPPACSTPPLALPRAD